MNVHDWALVVFTIAAQMSVGAFVVLGGVHFFATRHAGIEEADNMSDRALLAIGPVLVFGLIFSMLHLGNPLNAPRALLHLGTSWLSREILFGVLFAGGGFLFALLQWRKIGSPMMRRVLALITAAFGLLLVLSMSMVYFTLDSVPAWNSVATPIAFFATTLLLGALAIGAAFVASYSHLRKHDTGAVDKQREILEITLRWIALLAIAMLGVHFVLQPLHMARLAVESPTAQMSAAILFNNLGWLVGLRYVLIFIGAGIFALFIYHAARSSQNIRRISMLAYAAFAIVLVGELIGRFLFYASYARLGPP